MGPSHTLIELGFEYRRTHLWNPCLFRYANCLYFCSENECFKIRPVSHTSQCPSSCTLWALHEYSWKGYIPMRLHFLSILLLEEEGQEAVESKFRINISADNPQSKWSTGMIIQSWQDTQFHRGLLLISWCQSTSTSVYFHGCFFHPVKLLGLELILHGC